jgi:hypothetical protein
MTTLPGRPGRRKGVVMFSRSVRPEPHEPSQKELGSFMSNLSAKEGENEVSDGSGCTQMKAVRTRFRPGRRAL